MQIDHWTTCSSCDSEYKVVSSISHNQEVIFCPFCGSDISDDDEEEFNDYKE
jgi:hypothetical protein